MCNEQRLFEVPIPVIPNNDDVCQLVSSSSETVPEQSETSFDSTGTETENSVDIASNTHDSSDENISSSGRPNDSEVTPAQIFLEEGTNDALEISPDQTNVDPLIKEEPEFHLNDDDQGIFDEVLNFSVDVTGDTGNDPLTFGNEADDDERFLDEDKIEKFPMPMVASQTGLTKRENDPISMAMAFHEKVRCFLCFLNEHIYH